MSNYGSYQRFSIHLLKQVCMLILIWVGIELCQMYVIEGVVVPWCNPLTLQPEQSGGVGSNPGRAPPLERHDKGSRTRLGLLYFSDPSAWR